MNRKKISNHKPTYEQKKFVLTTNIPNNSYRTKLVKKLDMKNNMWMSQFMGGNSPNDAIMRHFLAIQ